MDGTRMVLGPAARYVGISPVTLRRWARERRIAHFRVGRKLVFSIRDLDRYLRQHRIEAVLGVRRQRGEAKTHHE